MRILKFLVLFALLSSTPALAQDTKNQSEIIETNASIGSYKIIADQYKSNFGRMEIANINKDKAQLNGHFEIILKEYPDHATESTRNKTVQYFADNIAFPVTYLRSTYEGNAKLQDKVGFVIREGRSIGADRIVFIDDYLFVLHNWKNKDDYEVRYALKSKNSTENKTEKKSKKKKKGFLKSLKEGMKNAASGSNISVENLKTEIVQPYLDKATKKQVEFYSQWIKSPENAKAKKFMDDKRIMMDKAMKQYNEDIFNSPEYQRMLAYHKWLKKNVNVTVHNKSGRTIWVGSSKEAFITHEIPAGGNSTQTCTTDMYYYSSDSKGTPGRKFYTADSSCGSSVTIN